MKFSIELGVRVRDRVSGFAGTVTGRVEYLSGCRQYLITPACKDDGAFVEPHWFDEDRLDVTSEKVVTLPVSVAGFDVEPPRW